MLVDAVLVPDLLRFPHPAFHVIGMEGFARLGTGQHGIARKLDPRAQHAAGIAFNHVRGHLPRRLIFFLWNYVWMTGWAAIMAFVVVVSE